jgi:hypothetical protein
MVTIFELLLGWLTLLDVPTYGDVAACDDGTGGGPPKAP